MDALVYYEHFAGVIRHLRHQSLWLRYLRELSHLGCLVKELLICGTNVLCLAILVLISTR